MSIGMKRRGFLASGLFCVGSMALAKPAFANYPSRPIRLIVGFPPGGSTDALARIFSPYLQEALGQPVIVENRPGANGALANATVKNADPDGHTLLLSNSSFMVATPHAATNAEVNPVTDLKHIAMSTTGRLVLLTSPGLMGMNLEEIIAYSKENPNAYTHASAGIGSLNELAFEMLQQATGSQIVTAQYQGTGPIMTDLLADRVHLTVSGEAAAESYLREGSVGAICSFGAERSPFLPDVPSSRELGIDMLDNLMFWNGLHAPLGVSSEVVTRLEQAVKTILANETLQKRLESMRIQTMFLRGDEFEEWIQRDWDMFGDIYQRTHG